jgi:hypothetical protein
MNINTTCPNHYARGNIEVWDFIRDQDLNYHLGNAIKYICRAGYKDSKADDLKKAIHYLQNELQHALTETEFNGHGGAIPLSVLFGDDSDDYAKEFDR